jgi:hypothetical protein
VPAGTTELRVALKGIADSTGGVDTDFYVRAGAPATPSQYDCADTDASTLGYCAQPSPQPGAWHVLVTQPLDRGEYQVTVTLIGPAPPPPVKIPVAGPAGRLLLGALLMATGIWRHRAARRPGPGA